MNEEAGRQKRPASFKVSDVPFSNSFQAWSEDLFMSPLNQWKRFFAGLLLFLSFQAAEAVAQQAAPPASPANVVAPAPASAPQSTKSEQGAAKALATDDSKNKGYPARDSQARSADGPPLEDFNTLAVPPGLDFDTLSLGKGDYQDYSTELVRGEWRAGDPVELRVIKPAGVKNPPVILYLYSFPSTADRFASAEFCKVVTQNGFAAVGFVSALTGERYAMRPMKQWFVSELQEALSTSVHDVQFILNYLDQRGDVDMTRVGMFGEGSGASIAIMAAAADPRIKALDLLDPWGDWPDWLAHSTLVPEDERAAYLKPEFLKKVENLDAVKWLPQLKTQSVRLQFIEGLAITPKQAREREEAAAPSNVKVVHYENAKAFKSTVASSGKGFDWIKGALGWAAPVPQNAASAKSSQDTSNSN